MRSAFVHAGFWGFLVGVAFQFLWNVGWEYGVEAIIVGIASILIFRSKKRVIVYVAIFLICLGLGIARSYHSRLFVGDPMVIERVGESVTLEGIVSDDPQMSSKGQKVLVDVGKEDVSVSVPSYPIFSYGDKVVVEGKLELPEAFETDLGRTFDYPSFLARKGIFHVIKRGNATLIEVDQGNPVRAFFIKVKHSFVESIERSVSEPSAGLASGVVLGVEGALSEDDEEAFRVAGLIHIIVVSGYNITMAGDFVRNMLSSFSTVVGSLGSIVGIVVYIMIAGASSTAIRAGIMAGLTVLARVVKRRYNVTRSLMLAACLMIFHVPYILLYDPSFQLSFLATWGLVSIAPLYAKHLTWVPETGGLRETLGTTLGAQTAVTPILLYQSGMTNLLTLPANLVVLPTMPLFMIGSLAAGVAGFFGAFIALPFSILIEAVGAYVFWIVKIADSFPSMLVDVGVMPVWLLILLYIVIGACVLFMKPEQSLPRTIERQSPS